MIYKGIWISMRHGTWYGHYEIYFEVGNFEGKIRTTDSLLYDQWRNLSGDDEAEMEAVEYCYSKVKEACSKGGRYYDEYLECGFEFED